MGALHISSAVGRHQSRSCFVMVDGCRLFGIGQRRLSAVRYGKGSTSGCLM